MTVEPTKDIELVEYKPKSFPQSSIPEEVALYLWKNYSKQITIEFPSPITQGQWRLTSEGWVGFIPLPGNSGISITPKVPLRNLFRMWEYAYDLKFLFPPGLFESASLQEFYEQLATILARRVLDRTRKGLYKAYIPQSDRLPYVRGRIDIAELSRAPWSINPYCHYEEHTADVEDNQILAWTLFNIAHSGLCSSRTLPTVLKAYRDLQGNVSLRPFSPDMCVGRAYNRLNDDYQPMHALSRFFLERTGPTHELGNRTMLPFLVDMSALFELFVAKWLGTHLPPTLTLKTQARVPIGHGTDLEYRIDLILCDPSNQSTICVLDTKYKVPATPSTDDISQAIAYATVQQCYNAFLIYPTLLSKPLNALANNIRVRSVTFPLDGDLDQSGHHFQMNLLEAVHVA